MSKLGEALRNARVEKGISLDELQKSTKIQKRYLQAIEQGDYGQLPGRFYARAFMKSYAEAVGLDSDELFEEHSGETPNPHAEVVEQIPSRMERTRVRTSTRASVPAKVRPSVLPKLAAAVVIIGLLVVVWMAFQKMGSNSEAGPVNQPGQNGTSVTFSENPAVKNQKKTNVKNKSAGKQKSSNKQPSKNNKQKQQSTKPTPTLKQTGVSNGVYQYTLTNAKSLKFKLSVTGGDSWIEIRKSGSTGNKYVYGMIHPGQTITKDLSSLQKIYLNIGSTSHVKMLIDGKPFTYPANMPHQEFLITFQSAKNAS